MLQDYLGRFDGWHLLLTAVPLAGGALGALLARTAVRHLGKVIIGYALLGLGVGFAPEWLRAAGLVPGGPLRPVLLETKLVLILGVLAILAAGGRAVQAEARDRAAAPS
jgi:hypothetical protein